MAKIPSAEAWAARYSDELEKMLRHYAQAVLEAIATELEPDDGWRDESTHHNTVMRTLKQAAAVVRKFKDEV